MILAPLHLQPRADGLLYWGCLDCGAGQSSPDKPATAFDMLCRACQQAQLRTLTAADEDNHLVQDRSDELQDQADKDAKEWRGSRDA